MVGKLNFFVILSLDSRKSGAGHPHTKRDNRWNINRKSRTLCAIPTILFILEDTIVGNLIYFFVILNLDQRNRARGTLTQREIITGI